MTVHRTEPGITLIPGEWKTLEYPGFFHATDGAPGKARTHIRLRIDEAALSVAFECLDDPYLHANTYTVHNTDLWRQEVFEVFIAEGADVPARYLELEINPNNALFSAWVDNLSGMRPEKLDMVSHEDSGIRHAVNRQSDSWTGEMHIPLKLIGKSPVYRLNFYRIVLHTPPDGPTWECGLENCDFLCWSPTMSGTEPAFHRPRHFGRLQISEK